MSPQYLVSTFLVTCAHFVPPHPFPQLKPESHYKNPNLITALFLLLESFNELSLHLRLNKKLILKSCLVRPLPRLLGLDYATLLARCIVCIGLLLASESIVVCSLHAQQSWLLSSTHPSVISSGFYKKVSSRYTFSWPLPFSFMTLLLANLQLRDCETSQCLWKFALGLVGYCGLFGCCGRPNFGSPKFSMP